ARRRRPALIGGRGPAGGRANRGVAIARRTSRLSQERLNMSPLFAILLPIIRPPALLPLAIDSVLAQTITDFELLVVCDGAPPETVTCAEGYARRDPRVKVFPHPKGARRGEAYRHSALATSTARYVAHIGDDDLWMPDHLTEM